MQGSQRKIASIEGGSEAAQRYWRTNITLILSLLAVWALVSYGAGYALALPLQNVMLGNVPLGFWFAQQGAIFVFIILIFTYATVMDRIDRQFGVHE